MFCGLPPGQLLAFVPQLLRDSWIELTQYFTTLSTWQWGVLSASVVCFTFLCLRGHRIHN